MGVHWSAYRDARAAAEACGAFIVARLEETLSNKDDATLALSGGSSPRLLFEWLAARRFPWRQVHFFWVDERAVPPTHARSNYRLAAETLLMPLGIPQRNIHHIHGELRPDIAAREYVNDIRAYFGLEPGEMPRFDVIHRGVGPDAHTASLFPGEPLIDDRQAIAAAVHVEKLNESRVTLLPGPLEAAANTAVLSAGADKAEAVRAVFQEPCNALLDPAQLHSHNTAWFLDEPAARLIEAE
jgi:6-phosphogluconolactonase